MAVRSKSMPPIFARSVRTLQPAHFGVEVALQRILHREQLDEMAPAQLCRQCLHYPSIGERLGETEHLKEVTTAESPAVLGGQLCRHRRNNLLTVGSAFLAQDLAADAVADCPVEQHHAGVHGLGDLAAAGVDEAAQILQQLRRVRQCVGGYESIGLLALAGHGSSCSIALFASSRAVLAVEKDGGGAFPDPGRELSCSSPVSFFRSIRWIRCNGPCCVARRLWGVK
jgi:hypothetical protein